jgi:hypothetical protein
MDNPVYLDEDIPFVESGDYEIDDANGGGHGSTTTLAHGNIISLNHQTHQFHDDSIWSTNLPTKRGRRPKSTAVVITTTEPKRRGRKPKQELLSPKKSLLSTDDNKSNDILSESTDDINQKQQRRSTIGMKSNKKTKLDDQQQITGKLLRRTISIESGLIDSRDVDERECLSPVSENTPLTAYF